MDWINYAALGGRTEKGGGEANTACGMRSMRLGACIGAWGYAISLPAELDEVEQHNMRNATMRAEGACEH